LHTTPDTWHEKIDSAYKAGCRHFDGALKGFGGCPMAKDDLTGNMPTEMMVDYFIANTNYNKLNLEALQHSLILANRVLTTSDR
jgi:hydroxymethylglutaryl-CoA lyase